MFCLMVSSVFRCKSRGLAIFDKFISGGSYSNLFDYRNIPFEEIEVSTFSTPDR